MRIRLLPVAIALLAAACARDGETGLEAEAVIDRGLPFAGAGLHSSLALDSAGKPHVAYYHADSTDLRVARWAGTRWEKETVDGGGETDRGRGARLLFGPDDTAYLAYQDSDEQSVLFASRRPGAGWVTAAVDASFFQLGDFLDLTLTPFGPAVAYYDATNGDLMYAQRDPQGGWARRLVDDFGDVGRHVSLTSDSAGGVHFAYYDASRGGLRYARMITDGTFSSEAVAGYAPPAEEGEDAKDPGDTGVWSRLLVQPQGAIATTPVTPRIVYADRLQHRLWLAEKTDAGWTSTLIDDSPSVGSDAAFLWLPSGDLFVAYFDGANLDLKVARRYGGRWSRQSVLNEGAVGLYNSAALLPAGDRIAITTYDLSHGSLLYLVLPVRP